VDKPSCPPGVHESGELLVWHVFDSPTEISLLELSREVRTVACAALLARHWPAKGDRDTAALALSGALVRAGWDAERVSRFVEAVAVAAGDDEVRMRADKAERTERQLHNGGHAWGWPKLAELLGKQGQAVVERVRQWLDLKQTRPLAKRLRSIDTFTPFPHTCLPPPLNEFVLQSAAALGCDPSFVALPVLSTVASAIGNARVIQLKPGWVEPAVVWTAVVAESGTLKSPAWYKAVAPLYRRQKQHIAEYKDAHESFLDDLRGWELSKKKMTPRQALSPKPRSSSV
jgi:hypothetical protein